MRDHSWLMLIVGPSRWPKILGMIWIKNHLTVEKERISWGLFFSCHLREPRNITLTSDGNGGRACWQGMDKEWRRNGQVEAYRPRIGLGKEMAGVWQDAKPALRLRHFGRWYFPASWCRCSTWYSAVDLSDPLMFFSLVSMSQCQTLNSNIFQRSFYLQKHEVFSFFELRNGLTPAARFIGQLWVDCSSQTSRIHLPHSGKCRLRQPPKNAVKRHLKILNAIVLIGSSRPNILDYSLFRCWMSVESQFQCWDLIWIDGISHVWSCLHTLFFLAHFPLCVWSFCARWRLAAMSWLWSLATA